MKRGVEETFSTYVGFAGYVLVKPRHRENLLRDQDISMPRIQLSPADLKQIALADIRSRTGCDGVGNIEIIRLTFPGAKSNWSLRVTDVGTANRDLLQLTALTVQRHLEKKFTLIADVPI